ncbi:hypothetical protein [Mycobacterium intracellulare]|uniref:hypothetical protein n=1 Tax=Mycobacterium intracellulare TaxID=1767 RepID=UPI001F6014C2|nr:hypothetical protein [Mycobacterium intracellulare]
MARYGPPDNGGDDETMRLNSGKNGKRPSLTPWYRRPAVLLGVALAILIALIIWGLNALFTSNHGGVPSITTTTTPATTTATPAPTTTESGGFHLPTLPSEITLPTLPSVITLPSLP